MKSFNTTDGTLIDIVKRRTNKVGVSPVVTSFWGEWKAGPDRNLDLAAWRAAARSLGPGLLRYFPPKPEVEHDDVLVMHMRAGDGCFRGPHPRYGQPPCSYYREVQGKFNKSFVVSEDNYSNPCTRMVIEAGATFRPGKTIFDDLSMIARARNVVTGRGTFAWLPLNIAPNVSDVYVYGWPGGGTGWQIGWPLMEHKYHTCVPLREYEVQVMNRWGASPKQLELMVSSRRPCQSWEKGLMLRR
jgi:hypothetical protein